MYDGAGNLKWGFKTPGGNGGKGATASNVGSGGSSVAQNSCQIYQNGAWTNTNCYSQGPAGNSGSSATGSTAAANGGVGGGSMYNTSTLSGGGYGGSSSSSQGGVGTAPGAGGGGGTTRFYLSGSTTVAESGKGGKGADGIVKITYNETYPGAGGGGGGGGAFAHIKNLSVTSGTTYKVIVGGGGSGGAPNTSGLNGGKTEITIGGSTYSLSGGIGGVVGTSATDITALVQGVGGSKGIVSSSVSDTSNLTHKNGADGLAGGEFSADATILYGGSYGGNGGVSGIDTQGGCGGLFTDNTICTNPDVNGVSTAQFARPQDDVGKSGVYGSSGSGGAGGGWSEDVTTFPHPGSGSGGLGGYVFLYWTEY